MSKDWTGNRKTTFVTLGASNHTDHDRAENDFYASEPRAMDELLKVEKFEGTIWENACGQGHLSEQMIKHGYEVISTDLIDRGYGKGEVDFFQCTKSLGDNIVTNPPYSKSLQWVRHSLELLDDGKKLALFLPIQFLESDTRIELFKNTPPKRIWVAANRLLCGINGDFRKKDKNGNVVLDRNGNPQKMSSAKCYAWFVWEKNNYSTMTIGHINTEKSYESNERWLYDYKPHSRENT